MARNRRNIRSRRTGRSRKVPSKVRVMLNGTKLRTTADPSEVVRQPWNSLTLPISFTTTTLGTPTTLTPSLLANYVKSQVGLPNTVALELRVHRVSAWDFGGEAVGLRTFDLLSESTATAGNPLAVLTDRAGRNRWAKVGYLYPTTQRNNSLASTDTTTTVFQVENGNTTSVGLIKVQVLWRPATDIVPSMFYTSSLINPKEISEEVNNNVPT